VNDPVVVQMLNASQQLHQQRLDLANAERLLHRLHESLHVVLDVVHDDVDLVHVAADHYLLRTFTAPVNERMNMSELMSKGMNE